MSDTFRVEISCIDCGYVKSDVFYDEFTAKEYFNKIKTCLNKYKSVCSNCHSAREAEVSLFACSSEKNLGSDGDTTETTPIEDQNAKIDKINKDIKKSKKMVTKSCDLCSNTGTIEIGHRKVKSKNIKDKQCPICEGKGYLNEK